MDKINFDAPALSVRELEELIRYHNHRYWELGEPEIEDARYDELIRALRDKAPGHELLDQLFSPSVASSDTKVRHAEPMLSLDKAYSLEEVLAWAKKYARTPEEMLLVQPKYDGISALYDGRILSTRGDGFLGEDVTDKLPLLELESPQYRGPLDRPARGEILIRKDDFETLYSHIRKKDGGFYKNPRNAVAGIMGLKEIGEMILQKAKLTLADYTLISIPVPLARLQERWQLLEEELAGLPYPMDGIVLKLADEEYRRSLGATAHHPRGEIAYKFTNRRAETELLDVEWSFGKNCLTPVAILEPVELSGTTIRRATLHNAQNLLDMDIQIGDRVTLERAGDVIPCVVAVQPGLFRQDPMIRTCPACGTGLIRRGPELCCPNDACPGTLLQQLLASVRSLGIDNLGEPTLQKLVTAGLVRTPCDLFRLTVMDLLQLPGFAEKSARNLILDIGKVRELPESRVLAALNVPNVGLHVAQAMLEQHSLEELRTMSAETLAEIPGIGPERAAALVRGFAEKKAYLDELLSLITLRRESAAQNAGRPTVCFTGKMPEKRSYYEQLAREHGYQPVGSVTSTLTLLVAADPAAAGGKLKNAAKFGTRVLALEDFLRELKGAE